MWPVDASGGSRQADLVASCNLLAGNYLDFTQVGIIGEDALTMVYDDDISGIKKVSGQSDDS